MKSRKWLAGAAVMALATPFGVAHAAQPTALDRFERAPSGQIDSKLVPNSQSKAPVRVIVEVTGDPVAVVQAKTGKELTGQQKAAIRKDLQNKQKAAKDKAKALGGKVLAEMQDAYNGVKVEVAGSALADLAKAPNVKAIHAVEIHTRTNATSGAYLGVPQVWKDTGFTGKGVKVGIIDTGIDYTHAMFEGPGTVEAFEAANATDTEPADPALFGPNAPRVKGGYDLVGDAYDASADPGDPALTPQPDPNPLDCNGHGSHVAGTAAGSGVVADGSAYTGEYPAADGTAWKIGPGVAPEADLYAYRVFGCSGSTDVTVEAIDRAVKDGMDVINMSLGSPYGTAEDPSSVAATNAVGAGVVVVASAGNSGPNPYLTGSPGAGKGVVAVAANDSTATFPGVQITLPGGTTIPAINANGVDPVPAGPFTVVHLKDIAGTPENEAQGCSLNAYTANGIKSGGGQLAVSVRGNCARVARAVFAQQAGAAAAAMVNTTADFPPYEGPITGNPDTGEDYTVTIPFLGVRGVLGPNPTDDGDKLVASDGKTVTLARADLQNPAFTNFASFSSGGPRTGDSGLSPSVTAPGVSIFSAEVGTGNGGYFNSGTSMAAPQVTGVAALNVEAHPDWDAATIAANLINTADPDKVGNYTMHVGGGGLVDVMQSVTNQVTAVGDEYETDHGTLREASLSFGFVEGTSTWSDTKAVQVTNHGDSPVTLSASGVETDESVGANVTVSSPSVTIPAGGTASVDVTMTVDFTQVPAVDNADLFSFYESSGHLVFTGDTEIRVPYLAVPRAASNVAFENAPTQINPGKGEVPLTLTNKGGAVTGTADFYAFGVKDAEGDVSLGGHPGTDLRAAGVQSWPMDGDQLLVFAVNSWDRYSNAARNQLEVLVDSNKDGKADWSVFATDSGLVRSGSANGINEVFLYDIHAGGLYAAGFLATSPTDNSTVLLPVMAGDLGLSAKKGEFQYTAYVSSLIDSAAYDAMDEMASYNPWKPSYVEFPYAEIAPNTSETVTIQVTGAGMGNNKSGGLMAVVFDNAAGEDEALILEPAVGQGKPVKPSVPAKP